MAAGVKATQLAKPAPSAQAAATVIHLYGITKSPGPAPDLFRRSKGVDGAAPVQALACAGFICWISRVPEAEFAQELSDNMQNLDWLAAATTRHQEVISAIAQAADILPARFGIEFLNEKSLLAHVESRKSILEPDFNRIRGKEEWGVKVFGLSVAAPMSKKKIRTGREYLQAKSALVRRPVKPSSPELAEFAKALQSVADEVAEGGKFAATNRDLEFHKTILLKRKDRKKLESLARSYSRKWKHQRRIECTGPWPPFSFVSRTESSE
jgi:Gas vesicle synthesis protein GvpL/GvpF